jgi:ABC-type multidrug transport system fused ATPase/permease subunit
MKLKTILKNRFSDFLFFYFYLGKRIFLALILSFAVGLMDGLGLAMFIPLLQLVEGGGEYSPDSGSIGNMDYFIYGLNYLGLSLNLITVLLLILVFFSLKGVFKFLESYYNVVLGTRFVKRVRFEAVECITNLNYRHFIRIDSGKIQNSFSTEVDRVQQSFKFYSSSIQAMMTVLVYVFLAFLTNPQFALLVIIGGTLSNVVYNGLYKKTKETSKKITLGNHTFHGLMLQQIHNFKYLRATGQIFKYNQKIKDTIVELVERNRKIGFYNSILVATKEPLSISVVVIVIIIQTYYFNTALGPIILSLLFFYRSLNQIIVFQNNWNTFLNYSGSLSSYKEFITDLKKNKLEYNSGYEVKHIDQIKLVNVDFSYDDKRLLKNINLDISKNKTIAFVGPSGSGKTTLSNIITGLLPIQKGQLLVNGKELRDSNVQQIQSKIGYITQEPVIFNDTLFNNVTFWAEKTPDNLLRFQESIQKASLSDFLTNLDLAEDTPLGNNGVMVSGGQKQRIAIARELFKTVDLLVLDEATSALDSSTEQEIQSYFEQLNGSFTIIVIAHRLSTIKSADVIYLLKDGEIQASGDFFELQEKSPDFKRMVDLQDFSYAG